MIRNRLCPVLKPEFVDSRLRAYELITQIIRLVIGVLDQDFTFGALAIGVGSDVSDCSRRDSCKCSARPGQSSDDVVDLKKSLSA